MPLSGHLSSHITFGMIVFTGIVEGKQGGGGKRGGGGKGVFKNIDSVVFLPLLFSCGRRPKGIERAERLH